MQTWNLTGRVAVVNQAAAENGPAICESLRQMGAIVVEVGGTQINHLEGLVAQAVQAYGRVDIMVNNTQLYPAQSAEDLPANIFRHQVSANVDSVFFGCQIAGRHMLAQQPLQSQPFPLRGVIINIASVAGVVAIPGHAAFCAAMAGIIAITKVLAAEWGSHGVRVVAVGAGITEAMLKEIDGLDNVPTNGEMANPVETYMTLQANAPRGYTPLGATVSPEAVGQAVAFLAGDAASYTTGATLFTDGGWLAYGYL